MIDADHVYDQDSLRTQHNHQFMNDPAFQAAYARGRAAAGMEYKWQWRVHTALWAASHAAKLEGDFVECGVAKGFMSSAVMQFLDWNRLGKTFWLLDTFSGLDPRYVLDEEVRDGALGKNDHLIEIGLYATSPDGVVANFSEWDRVRVVAGSIPDTLPQAAPEKVAYLHVDMNCAPPEVAAVTHFWDRLVPGGVVLLDDYAYHGYPHQYAAMNDFAASRGVSVLSLPTGQGMILKPPA